MSVGKGRRWWWKQGANYHPPFINALRPHEQQLFEEWYASTEETGGGECNVPMMCLLYGLITGSRIKRIVQLGHCRGFSTLALGFTLRHLAERNPEKEPYKLLSFEVNPTFQEMTQSWVDRAKINDFVTLKLASSTCKEARSFVHAAFDGYLPQLIFIDSSHQYGQTLKELDLWFGLLQPGGLVVMHDSSRRGANVDKSGEGGVGRALDEWISRFDQPPTHININGDILTANRDELVYKDGMGAAIIQKPNVASTP